MTQHMTTHMQECIDNCQECQEVCLEGVSYCLERGGDWADPDCVALLITCADICGTSAKAMLVGTEHHTKICKACAEICDAVVEDFEEFDDRMSRRLVKVSRKCAESCREMSRFRGVRGGFRAVQSAFDQYVY